MSPFLTTQLLYPVRVRTAGGILQLASLTVAFSEEEDEDEEEEKVKEDGELSSRAPRAHGAILCDKAAVHSITHRDIEYQAPATLVTWI